MPMLDFNLRYLRPVFAAFATQSEAKKAFRTNYPPITPEFLFNSSYRGIVTTKSAFEKNLCDILLPDHLFVVKCVHSVVEELQTVKTYLTFVSEQIPGDFRSWESPVKADNVWQLFIQILLR